MGIEQDVRDVDDLARRAWVISVCAKLGQDEFWTLRVLGPGQQYRRVYTSHEIALAKWHAHPDFNPKFDTGRESYYVVHWKLSNFIEVDV